MSLPYFKRRAWYPPSQASPISAGPTVPLVMMDSDPKTVGPLGVICTMCKQKMATDGIVPSPTEWAVGRMKLPISRMSETDRVAAPEFAKISERLNSGENVMQMEDLDEDFTAMKWKNVASPMPSPGVATTATNVGGNCSDGVFRSTEAFPYTQHPNVIEDVSDDDFTSKGSAALLRKLLRKGISPVLHRDLIADMRYHGKMKFLQNQARYGRGTACRELVTPDGETLRPRSNDGPSGQCLCAGGYNPRRVGERIKPNHDVGRHGRFGGVDENPPSFSITMKNSAVAKGFFLHLPTKFCRDFLPDYDVWFTFEDEFGYTWRAKYLGLRFGLSAGWRRLALDKRIQFGDVVTFTKISDYYFYIRISSGISSGIPIEISNK